MTASSDLIVVSAGIVEGDDRAVGAAVRNFGHGCVTAQTGEALAFGERARVTGLSGGRRGAEVAVSYDGATPVPVATFTRNTSGQQRFVLAVPAGADTARVRFRYTGTNNWYWAVDQVRVTPGG